MAIRGSLAEASLGDVLQLLALGNKTGALTVAGDGMLGTVFFDGGRIAHATVLNHRARFAERLVRDGLTTASEIAARRARGDGSDDELALAMSLVAADRRCEPPVREALRAAVEGAVYTMFTWSQGTFSFDPEVTPDAGPPWFALNAESLLLEGARRLDEWSVVQRRVPSFDLIFDFDEARLSQSGAPLSVEQMAVARWLDGTNDVHAVMARSGLSEFDAGQALYALIVAGFAQEVGRSTAGVAPVSDARLAEHRNLGIAFHRAELLDDAAREFGRVLEHRPDDGPSRLFLALGALRRGAWNDAVQLLQPMAVRGAPLAVHLNLSLAYEQQGNFAEALAALEAADSDDPRVFLARAHVALETDDRIAVREALDRARDASGARAPSPLWYHLSALVAGLDGQHQVAQQLLEDGIAAYPAATALHNNLAVVHERRGAYEAGAAVIEHAMLQDAALPQLHKNLGDYLYRHARYDEADEAYARSAQLAPAGGPDVYLKRGNIAYRRGDSVAAASHWERALHLDPDNPMARGNLQAVRGGAS